mmetsp:Transcript_6299/g.12551  ORF Transcript_6299/g.12551 Transcript_6299/m.12551 type:complete len:88 (+) Transcript_6299:1547-1810(+)
MLGHLGSIGPENGCRLGRFVCVFFVVVVSDGLSEYGVEGKFGRVFNVVSMVRCQCLGRTSSNMLAISHVRFKRLPGWQSFLFCPSHL